MNYRVWNEHNRVMEEVTNIIFDKGEIVSVSSLCKKWDSKPPVMMGSGLKDINGIEIFEKDFLDGFEYSVSFEDGAFWVTIEYDLTRIPLHEFSMLEHNTIDTKIVGHSYNNPDPSCYLL